MYARVSRLELAPETYEQGMRMARTQILPSLRLQPGFRGFLVLGDPEGSRALVVSLWESPEAERESEREAAVLREDSAAALGAGVAVERYEVVLDEREAGDLS
jgi:heme-degrading monooxygenase HmoA